MRRPARVAIAVGSTLLFAFALANVDPYPYRHSIAIFLAAGATFALVLRVMPGRYRAEWCFFGVITFACWLISFYWFWIGAWSLGWWWPPHPKILARLTFVDGEAGYDAEVSDIFLILWGIVVVALAARHLTSGSSGRG